MTIRAVIFDLGHTLWDIGPGRGALERAYEEAHGTLCKRLQRDDVPDAIALRKAVSAALYRANETYFSRPDRLEQPPSHRWVDEGWRALGLTLDDALLRAVTPALFATEIESLICAEGTTEAVLALHDAGYVLGCVTNTLADDAAIRAMLRMHGIEGVMRSVVVSAEEGWRKPHPSLFEMAMRQLDVAPDEAVFIGDSPQNDIAGARSAGMHAVLTRQYVTRPTDGYPAPDATIDHVRELLDVIARLNEM